MTATAVAESPEISAFLEFGEAETCVELTEVNELVERLDLADEQIDDLFDMLLVKIVRPPLIARL